MKKLVFVTAIIAGFAIPAGALAGTFNGIVVGKSGGSLAVASKAGVVRTVHTRAHPRIGARVRVNGSSIRVLGLTHHARIRATVVKKAGNTTLVAAGHSLLAIRTSGRRLASLGSGPATGAVVDTTVGIANGQLTQGSIHVVGEAGSVSVQAQISGVAPGMITLLVNGQTFSIPLPAGIQLPSTLVGQFVNLRLDLSQASPVANAEDDDQAEAEDNDDNDQADDQGDDHGQEPGDHQGDDGDD